MTEVLNNSFDIVATRRTYEALDNINRVLATDLRALEEMARRVGVTALPLPDDVRVILRYRTPGDRRPDEIDYPSPRHRHHAYMNRLNDIHVTTPRLDEPTINAILARELYRHQELSPETADKYQSLRNIRWGYRGAAVAGFLVVVGGGYVSGDVGQAMAVGGGLLSAAGLVGEGTMSLSHTVQMVFNPQEHPSLQGLSAPIGLVER